ncbi:hypothetical protein GOP47_0005179 [Adiantum capillus-veneris]|uniref:Uncharacterized protein n=1 Tax=Adiantum capillus-veneris TaxID=13818 RepID=A0A9D4V588_ADICA|nr:hypothetical protein GOP47_0005179 [Adiantum capillus-veneris]
MLSSVEASGVIRVYPLLQHDFSSFHLDRTPHDEHQATLCFVRSAGFFYFFKLFNLLSLLEGKAIEAFGFVIELVELGICKWIVVYNSILYEANGVEDGILLRWTRILRCQSIETRCPSHVIALWRFGSFLSSLSILRQHPLHLCDHAECDFVKAAAFVMLPSRHESRELHGCKLCVVVWGSGHVNLQMTEVNLEFKLEVSSCFCREHTRILKGRFRFTVLGWTQCFLQNFFKGGYPPGTPPSKGSNESMDFGVKVKHELQ